MLVKKKTIHFSGILFLIVVWLITGTIQAEETTWQEDGAFQTINQESYLQEQMQDLRVLHESTLFLLKRYATCEALISAMDQGKQDEEAYWIGAASLVPGIGQMINRDYLQGGLLLFASTISLGSVRQLGFTRKKQSGSESLLPAYYASMILRNGLMTYAMLHASQKNYETTRNRTEAMWTGMASMVPGVGQAVNQDWWEAGGFFVAWAAATVLTSQFEERIFIDGNEGYLVEHEDETGFSVALLPGGARIDFNRRW